MHRSILTGLFVFSLSAATVGAVSAAETTAVLAPATVSASQSVAAPVAAAATAEFATAPQTSDGPPALVDGDSAPVVSSGARLAMWNAPAFTPAQYATQPARPLNRLRRFASGIVSRSSAIASSLTRSAIRFIGVPYVFGGTRTTGFDCSGYVQHVFSMHGLHLPRTADAQFDAGRRIRAKMAAGDLVFFHTYAPGVSHVGIYLGNNRFIHASSSRGVAVSSLHDRYWAPRYLGAKRVVGS